MKVTYNQIVQILSSFFESHYQVNSFRNGDLWEAIQSNSFQDALYPLAFLVDGGANTTQGKVGLTFDLLCMDLVDKGEQNENEVKSDTLRILLDAVAYLEQLRDGDWYSVNIDKQSNLSSFTESMDDELTGWKITITLNQPFNYNACAIPYDGVSLVDVECAPVTVTDTDQITIVEVASGGSFVCTPSGVCEDVNVSNSNDSYDVDVASGGSLVLPNINFTDSDNTTTSIPSMEDIVATPQVKELYLYLNYKDTNDIIEVEGNLANAGTYNIGSPGLEISTDGIIYTPLSYPFTTVNGTLYYFKRTTALVPETKVLIGEYV